jgi:hypothetical protein
MGISMHVMPRMAGVPLAHPSWRGWILWLMTGGLVLRIVGHSLVAYVQQATRLDVILGMIVLSGLLELMGIGLYLGLMGRTIGVVPGSPQRPALRAIRPFMQSMMLGWALYASLNLILLAAMAWQRQVAVHTLWNDIAIRCFVGLVLLPVAFAFSVRFLPLYLRLAPPTWPVHRVAYVYLLGWCLEVVTLILSVQSWMPHGGVRLMQAGQTVKGIGMLWFIWRLGVLTCGRFAWLGPTSSRRTRTLRQSNEANREFGAFGALIVSAYIWLAVAAVGELLGNAVGIRHDVLRHLYLMGFVTLLILGVAVRMLPGLMRARRVAHPGLVGATLWFGNAAVIGRVLLLGLPGSVWQGLPPWAVQGARIAFAWSGMLALVAVLCLTLNLGRTARMVSREAVPARASAPAPE